MFYASKKLFSMFLSAVKPADLGALSVLLLFFFLFFPPLTKIESRQVRTSLDKFGLTSADNSWQLAIADS